MGLFGGRYNKPGKGVDKNAPKKKGFFLFWEIIARKFTKFLQANFMYALTSIGWLAVLYFFMNGFLMGYEGKLAQVLSASGGADTQEAAGMLILSLNLLFVMGIFMLWGFAPISAPFAYIMRCFTRGEHVWIMSDGFSKFKENIKQSLIVLLVDVIVLIFGLNALLFYYSAFVNMGGIAWMILCYITFLLLLIYTMIHPYLYQLMVTFKCTTGQLYKNAVLLTLGRLPMNFLLTVTEALFVFIVFICTNPMFALIFTVFLGPCIMCYPNQFYAARIIEKSILSDMEKKTNPVKITYLDEDENTEAVSDISEDDDV